MDGQPLVTRLQPGEIAGGLCENCEYAFGIDPPGLASVFVDDELLIRSSDESFRWSSGFFAGRVNLVVVRPGGREYTFSLDVSPTSAKVGKAYFSDMVADIRQFDPALLLRDALIAHERFGYAESSDHLRWLVRLARLRLHGPAFIDSVTSIARSPHQFLRPVRQLVPLASIRRLHPAALNDRRLQQLTEGSWPAGDLDSIQLPSYTPCATVETAANRALKSLLLRFTSCLDAALNAVIHGALEESPEDQRVRSRRRIEVLQQMRERCRALLQGSPFDRISRPETTAAGLTQIAANPTYASAYRRGTAALRMGLDGAALDDELPISPTWGIYETWCLVRLLSELGTKLATPFSNAKSTTAHADLCIATDLGEGLRVEVLFQGTFRSGAPHHGCLAWSLSRERRPDIVLVAIKDGQRRFLVLDAKYRSGRENVLDAMCSAHIYQDSLRLGSRRPDLSLLLLPGAPAVSSLEASEFWDVHRVGTVSNISIAGDGWGRIVTRIVQWLEELKT